MPNMATLPAPSREAAADSKGQGATLARIPFVRASREHVEQFGQVASLGTAATQILGPLDVPAVGFLRHVLLEIAATGGAGGSGAFAEDGPWSAIQTIALTDVSGSAIVGPLDGYSLYQINKRGGYEGGFLVDPAASPAYTVADVANGNFRYLLRLPVEIAAWDALGALPNLDSSAKYKLPITLNNMAGIFGTPPAGAQPTVAFKPHVEAWFQPAPTDELGRPQETTPPAVGTTQYWSKTSIAVPAGQQTIYLPRVGGLLRNIILINRRTGSTRANGQADFPDPISLVIDGRNLFTVSKNYLMDVMWRRSGYATHDNGVFQFDFVHDLDGKLGAESRDQWLPTVQGTSLALQGTWANACTLDVLTNEVYPQGSVYHEGM